MCTWRIFLRITWWKNFENRSTFATDIIKHQAAYFFGTKCSFSIYQTLWQYSDGDGPPPPPNGSVECSRVGQNCYSQPISAWLHRVLWTVRPQSAIHAAATDRGKLLTLVAGKRRRFFTGDDDELFMTRSLNVTPKTTEQHLIVRSGKSVIWSRSNSNKRLRRGMTLLNWQAQASRGLSATAQLIAYIHRQLS